MPRLFARPTIARDLALGLVVTSFVVFGVAGTANYLYSVRRDTKALTEKANEVTANLASVAATPMWNLDTAELIKIRDVYMQSDVVHDIWMTDDDGRTLVAPRRAPGGAFLEMTRRVRYDDKPAGQITITFSDAEITRRHSQIALYSALLFAFLTSSLVIAVFALLRGIVTLPFARLKRGLEVISGGDYAHRFESERQADLNDITDRVMGMAREIAHREAALEENRNKLEILNQAILDIFSCSDTDSLMRVTLALAHKICNVDEGYFLAAENGVSSEENDDKKGAPMPLSCLQGHVIEAAADDVEPHIGANDGERTFTFTIKSRHRTVGVMTFHFDESPDPSVASLLKSLLSLASLAMIRQSFIRESAFIAAELQVAETVQRSLLHDDARVPSQAVVAWHYEPVHRVGGDWFSVVESRDGSYLYVLLGDVTGHGLAQGLVTTAMAGAVNVIESQIRGADAAALPSPSWIQTQLGSVVTRLAGKSNLRMTCVAARLDYAKMRLEVCNAGHTFPLLLHQHLGEPPKAQSLARNQQHMLGDDWASEKSPEYTDATYDLHADDLLLFYTDGLTEATNREGRAFLRPFHRYFHRPSGQRTAAAVRDELLALLRAHVGDAPIKDDICLVVVGKKGQAAEGKVA